MKFDVHQASLQEREDAFRNVFDVWPMAPTVEEHVHRRLTSAQHSHATWYVGCLQGNVVCSLGCYPIMFCLRGELVRGMAIGAVHTAASHRRRGLARRLIEEVESLRYAEETRISLLFSDIDPGYYERLGYVRCPAVEFSVDLETRSPMGEPPSGRLIIAERTPQAAALEEFRSGSVRRRAISIHRSDDYWEFLFRKEPDDGHFWYENADGERTGYVRLGLDGTMARLRDWALTETGAEAHASFLHAVFRGAQSIGAGRLSGWLPHDSLFRGILQPRPREREITMLKSLASAEPLPPDVIDAAGDFTEIDHV